MTADIIRMQFERRLLELTKGGFMPEVTSIHSIVLEDDVAHVAFDVAGFDGPLLFEFTRPAVVAPHDLREFVEWVAFGADDATKH